MAVFTLPGFFPSWVMFAAVLVLAVYQPHMHTEAAILRGGPNQEDSYFLEQLRPEENYFPDALDDDEVSLLTSGGEPRYEEQRFIQDALPDANCPGCAERQLLEQQLTPDELRFARIELIKKQILEKLRLEHAPNVTHRPLILPEPLRIMEEEILREDSAQPPPSEEDFYGKTTEVILFADTESEAWRRVRDCRTTHPAACIHIAMKDSLQYDDVKSAELWVFKQADIGRTRYGVSRNQTLVASRLGNPNHSATTQERDILDIVGTSERAGQWVKFEVRDAVRLWLLRGSDNHGIEVSCKDCALQEGDSPIATKTELRPFIVIHTRQKDRSRAKRETTHYCTSSTQHCCLERLNVNFQEIGWGDWILFPRDYVANYCRGSCSAQGDGIAGANALSTHTSIMMHLLQHGTPNRESLAPCCAPYQFKPMSIIYRSEMDALITSNIEDMIATKCGCH